MFRSWFGSADHGGTEKFSIRRRSRFLELYHMAQRGYRGGSSPALIRPPATFSRRMPGEGLGKRGVAASKERNFYGARFGAEERFSLTPSSRCSGDRLFEPGLGLLGFHFQGVDAGEAGVAIAAAAADGAHHALPARESAAYPRRRGGGFPPPSCGGRSTRRTCPYPRP